MFAACDGDEIFDEDAQLATDIALIEHFLDANGLEADTLLPSEDQNHYLQRGRR